MWTRLRSWWDALVFRSRFEREMSTEMHSHLEHRIEDLVASGMPRSEARRRARVEFGPVEAIREECREARGLRWTDELGRNLGFAFRQLRRNPSFTIIAVSILGLCIGANAAVFSVVDAVLLRPLPYPDAERLALVATFFGGEGASNRRTSQDGRTWELFRDHVRESDLAAFSGWATGANFSAPGFLENVRQQRVGAGFFRILGIELLTGREFLPEEDRPGGPAVTLLSHRLWQRALGGDPQIIGGKVLLRGEPYTVVGILPEDFESSAEADLWTPLRPSTQGEGSGANYGVLARPRPGVSLTEAKAEIRAVGQRLIEALDTPPRQPVHFSLVPLQRAMTADLRKPLLLLWLSVGVVLLIGCVNLAGLLLARAAARRREIGTRLALGGGRLAILRQLVTESLVLALGGGLVGLAVGYFAISALRDWMRDTVGLWQSVGLDSTVLLFTLGLAVLTSVLFGVFPAWRVSSTPLRPALSDGGNTSGALHRWPRRLLVITEVALGVVLLVGAGLLLRTVLHLNHLPLGFDPDGVVTATVSLQDARYAEAHRVAQLADRTLEHIRRLPGVEHAAVGLSLPFQRGLNFPFDKLDGEPPDRKLTSLSYVTPTYFTALRIPLLRGRPLEDTDGPDGARVALVNEAFVDTYLREPELSVVGRFLRIAEEDRRIVGVVGNVQQTPGWGDFAPLTTVPSVYVPITQVSDDFVELVHTWFSPHWIVATSGPVRGIRQGIREAISATDPHLPVSSFSTPRELRSQALALERFQASLSTAFAGLALLLAAVGIYGLISQSVVERRADLSVRLALGATHSDAVWEAARPGVMLALVGIGLGGALALPAARTFQHFLWGVEPTDPLTFVLVAAGLLAVASLASLLPALQVTRLDPARVLRGD